MMNLVKLIDITLLGSVGYIFKKTIVMNFKRLHTIKDDSNPIFDESVEFSDCVISAMDSPTLFEVTPGMSLSEFSQKLHGKIKLL